MRGEISARRSCKISPHITQIKVVGFLNHQGYWSSAEVDRSFGLENNFVSRGENIHRTARFIA